MNMNYKREVNSYLWRDICENQDYCSKQKKAYSRVSTIGADISIYSILTNDKH